MGAGQGAHGDAGEKALAGVVSEPPQEPVSQRALRPDQAMAIPGDALDMIEHMAVVLLQTQRPGKPLVEGCPCRPQLGGAASRGIADRLREGARDIPIAGLELGPPRARGAAPVHLPQHPGRHRLGARLAHPVHQDQVVDREVAIVRIARMLGDVRQLMGEKQRLGGLRQARLHTDQPKLRAVVRRQSRLGVEADQHALPRCVIEQPRADRADPERPHRGSDRGPRAGSLCRCRSGRQAVPLGVGDHLPDARRAGRIGAEEVLPVARCGSDLRGDRAGEQDEREQARQQDGGGTGATAKLGQGHARSDTKSHCQCLQARNG